VILGWALLLGIGSGLAWPSAAYAQQTQQKRWLDVEVGKTIVHSGSDQELARVILSDPTVAEIKVLDRGQISIRGIQVGSTDIWVWYKDRPAYPDVFEVTVHQDLSDLVRRWAEITDVAPRVYPLNGRLVVDGQMPDVQTLERVAKVAEVYDPDFVNLMSVPGDHQVQLDVVFAEVNRSRIRELGLNFLVSGSNAGAWVEGPNSSTAQTAADFPIGTGSLVSGVLPAASSATFNLLGVLATDPVDILAMLSVLEQNNLSKILAEPSLVTLSGQQAEFLIGGEIPVPVAQNNGRITLEYKEYGIKLAFIPTVLAREVVDLQVYIEVSDVDSATGTRITGIEIPGFVMRKAETHLRIDNGMTFAMAGLLSETVEHTRASIPLLGDIPIIGALFSYTRHERNETELMIFVTPRLVRPMAPDEVPPPPGSLEDNNPNDFELFLLGLDHRISPVNDRFPDGPVGFQR
jgi:pilus assembly protein CpaC